MKCGIKSDFWSKVNINGPDECWPWLGARRPLGYGNVKLNKKYWIAHRLAFHLTYGEIPPKTLVLHQCDNPPCCNPKHLTLGTNKKNSEEMTERGRCEKGEERYNSKLQWFDVHNIRTLYATGKFYHKDFADAYGVYRQAIGKVVNNLTWRHI